MNPNPNPTPADKPNPFWILLTILLLLGVEYTLRLEVLLKRRGQLSQVQAIQNENSGRIVRAQQLSDRLQPLLLELVQIATTNAAAKAVVDEFQIQYIPPGSPPATPSPPIAVPATNR